MQTWRTELKDPFGPFEQQIPSGEQRGRGKSGDLKLQRLRSWGGAHKGKSPSKKKHYKTKDKLHLETRKILFALDLNISCIAEDKLQFVLLLPSLYEFSTVTCSSGKLECARRVGTFGLLGHLWLVPRHKGWQHLCFWGLLSGKGWEGGECAPMNHAAELRAGSFLIRESLKFFNPSICVFPWE